MVIFTSIVSFIVGLILGIKLYKLSIEKNIQSENKKLIDNINQQYKQILSNINSGFSKFKARVNSTVQIESSLKDHGNVDIIYLLDRNDVAIFKDNKCLYTSEKVDKNIMINLTLAINSRHGKEISEVVNFFGLVFSKDEFEKTFKVDFDQLQKNIKANLSEISEMEKIQMNNELKFDIDEILDKISAFGIESLTFEERIFLDKYSNEQGN